VYALPARCACSSDSLNEGILRGGSHSSELEMIASDKDSPEATPRFVPGTLPTIPSSGELSSGHVRAGRASLCRLCHAVQRCAC
jgi:hypothetical protein